MPDALPRITRVDFTDKERDLLVKVFDVCGTFLLKLYGDKVTDIDLKNINTLMQRPTEVAALVVKINSDRISPDSRALVEHMGVVDDTLTKLRVSKIKATLTEVLTKHPETKSRMKDDMMWLCNELEKRL